MKIELSRERKTTLISVTVSLGLIILAILSGNSGVLGNVIILSAFILAVPQLFLRYEKFRELKEMEEKFPTFLRDLTESIRSGVPFHQAIIITSKLDYGKLSKQIKKMSNQISWGIPVDKVIEQFADRAKSSKRLNMTLRIIRESYLSGGDVVSTLESVSDSTATLEESEKERKSLLSQYVVLMYTISFIFLGIVVAINKFMVPIFQSSATLTAEVLGLSNPCSSAYGYSIVFCEILQSPAKYMFSIDVTSIAAYYTSLFFFMSVIVSVSSGLVAGQISENSVSGGIKHSLIMATVVVGAFYILTYTKLLGV